MHLILSVQQHQEETEETSSRPLTTSLVEFEVDLGDLYDNELQNIYDGDFELGLMCNDELGEESHHDELQPSDNKLTDSCDNVELSESGSTDSDNKLTDSCDDVELSESGSAESDEVDGDSSTCCMDNYEEEFITASCKACSEAATGMSRDECSLAVISIAAKHNISYLCVADFLRLLTQLLPDHNVIPESHYMLMKQFMAVPHFIIAVDSVPNFYHHLMYSAQDRSVE